MREAGQRVQPNLSRFTVASIIRTFREENRTQRRPPGGGRLRLLSEEQERELVNMVIANNVIRLREIQRRVIEDDHHFRGINAISLSTIDRILRKNQFRMKQVYRVPFERNSDRVKNQRVEYVQSLCKEALRLPALLREWGNRCSPTPGGGWRFNGTLPECPGRAKARSTWPARWMHGPASSGYSGAAASSGRSNLMVLYGGTAINDPTAISSVKFFSFLHLSSEALKWQRMQIHIH
ncbi:hypothetical protein QQF64_033750 [Cirrhinus molitorella]|uniref:Transposase n=1 Tax=Cirrhinus molitorella TaxID=172907 RepID=A0ABR3MUW3_9TELE